MHKSSFKLLALITIAATTGLITGRPAERTEILADIGGYRQWTRVTAQPLEVPIEAISIAG